MTTREARRVVHGHGAPLPASLIAAREPVVIEGLLHGTALGEISTAQKARELVGDVALELREEFVAWSLRNGGAADRRPMRGSTVAGYLHLLEAEPATAWMCTEFPTPPALLERMGPWPAAVWGDETPVSFSFVGGRGHHAHLHYDGDFRNVLLVQVFGTKRAVLVPPTASHCLLPVGNFSGVFMDRLAGAERAAFLDLVGAYTATIGPGDALFMPAALWHYLEYPETGMSINLRFGATAANARIAGRFHAHDSLQRIAWHLADGHVPNATEEEGLRELLALAGSSQAEPRVHGATVESFTAQLAREWCGPPPQAPFSGTADALREAATRYECERLYPRAAVSLEHALSGWGLAAR